MHDGYGDFVTNALARIRHEGLHYDVANSHSWDAGVSGQKIAEELQSSHVHMPHSPGWWKRHDMKGADPAETAGYRFDERIQKEFVLYRNCDHVIATSEQQVDLIASEYSCRATM